MQWAQTMLCATVLVMVCATSAKGHAVDDLSAVASQAVPAVCELRLSDSLGRPLGTGTAFFIADGIAITNYHVIAPAHTATAVLHDDTTRAVSGILASDPSVDLAIIAVPGTAPATLPLTPDAVLRQGQPVVVVGNPNGLRNTVSDGIISALRSPTEAIIDGRRLTVPGIQISAEIAPGSSGSPVMTLDAGVIAIAVSKVADSQTLGFAIPAAEATRLIASIAPGQAPAPLQGRDSRLGDGIQRAGGDGVWLQWFISILAFGVVGWLVFKRW